MQQIATNSTFSNINIYLFHCTKKASLSKLPTVPPQNRLIHAKLNITLIWDDKIRREYGNNRKREKYIKKQTKKNRETRRK